VTALAGGASTATLFAAAGWAGTILSDRLYGGLQPEDDGPPPVAVARWVFVAGAAAIGLVAGLHDLPLWQIAIVAIVVACLTGGAATDVRVGLIPNLFTLGPLVLVLSIAVARHDLAPLWGALAGLLPFAALALASRGRGMGWGDVKLAALGGALVGMAGIFLAVVVAATAAYAVARAAGRLRQPIAFGPYLAASIGAVLSFGTAW